MTEYRLTAMKGTTNVYLLFISGFYCFALGSSDFHLIEILKSYTEAKAYCRAMHTDLATVHNSTDMDKLITLVPNTTARAWIGLETGDVWRWHWSRPDQKLDFLNWKAGESQLSNEDSCAAMDQNGKWIESDCRTERSFVCHGNNVPSGLTFVAETKSWRNAQNHCRGLSSHLISIHSAEENEAVHNVSQNVWIGLFKDPWKWSDGSKTSFRYWKPNQPNYLKGQNCTVAVFKDDGRWNDLRCTSKRHFVCYGARKSVPTTTNQASTQGMSANPTTIKNTSQGVIITNNFTLDTTNQSHITNVTTTEALTTPNTTDLALTVTQQPLTTTVQVTTDTGSMLTTLMGTSPQSTTTTTSFPPGNLILIQENMTWVEAMSYCRKHYVDLVHITSQDTQRKVAEMASNATSSHVWLGLKFTCKFNFWFWTQSTPGCYHNWAPGQGPEGIYGCGVTGAIEATGRQQWVGLLETEKLNFICNTCSG